MSIGMGIAISGICAVPIAAMFAQSVSGGGLILSLIFAGIAIATIGAPR